MVVTVLIFSEGRRDEFEKHYREVGGSKPASTEELMFALKDPEIWVRAEGFPWSRI